MKYIIPAILTLLFSLTTQAENKCLDFFTNQYPSLRDFSETDLRLSEGKSTYATDGSINKKGYVALMGLSRYSGTWQAIGILEYSVYGKKVIMDRLVDSPEYHGQGV